MAGTAEMTAEIVTRHELHRQDGEIVLKLMVANHHEKNAVCTVESIIFQVATSETNRKAPQQGTVEWEITMLTD